ncbi:MAG: gliding motility lipoprotein GldB [Polaribacter sp.]|nr:gliding motility lipoprotein GldB [Polaribacter sp.]MDG1811298.1 gliding motility lipoprotein GldB [Polaribacter sp.]MDG1994490.1 gliding motility lipoprotein GldB [Polaribacter sp.]
MRKYFFIYSLFTILFSCNSKQENQVDVSAIEVDFTIDRFDVDFYSTSETSLFKTKEKYPLFFPKDTPDSVWVHKIKNKSEQELFKETQKVFSNIDFLKDDLEKLFKHIKYYNSTFKSPKVVTLLTNIDHQNNVLFTGAYLLISLDVYLGKNHQFYADYPSYIKQNFEKENIIVDVARAMIPKNIHINDRTFVSKMILEGKKLYLLDKYLPSIEDYQKVGYSVVKNNWAIENEKQVWKYFIENKMLFSTETKLNKRFLEMAPFSKFYRSEDTLSPGRIGAWIGWQIVRSYMKHNDVSLQQLLKTPSEEVYKNSKYKPKK